MKVYLLSAFSQPGEPATEFPPRWLQESAETDPFGEHEIVEHPEEADIILFVESHETNDPYMLTVARHPVWRQYESKCFLYHDADWAVPILRGIYPSIGRREFQPERCRSGGYIARIEPNQFVTYDPSPCPREYLYAFSGAANCPVRRSIFSRDHPRGLVCDTTGKALWELRGHALQTYQRKYVDDIQRSYFVLCPRGYGPASYRLFETMEMGRVPVVMSDQWVPPEGPPWRECILLLPENSVSEIDKILASCSDRAEAMGVRAREVWEQWFSKPVSFHRVVQWCAELKHARPGLRSALRAWNGLLHPPHSRIWLGGEYRQAKTGVQRLMTRILHFHR